MSGRMFRTLDSVDYSYDVCNHILLRDRINHLWSITVHRNCVVAEFCSRSLKVNHEGQHITFQSDMQVEYNGFTYTLTQAQEIRHPDFDLEPVGDSIRFVSHKFGFEVVWNSHSGVKVQVRRSELMGRVDGLCGLYNDVGSDDLTQSDGRLALSTDQFADSWTVSGYPPLECHIQLCPFNIQKAAWKKCAFLRKEPFDKCPQNITVAMSRCVEHYCDCVKTPDAEQCQCKVMSLMATECQEQDQSVDLSGWRSKYDCQVECPGGAVFHECNQRNCEVTCNNMKNPNACPRNAQLCYPGCVCPDGLVRKNEKCVKPAECRDCVCDGFAPSQYFSFDRNHFDFNGNCSYVAARDQLDDSLDSTAHDFQVLVTNHECEKGGNATCTGALTVLFREHVINIDRHEATESVHVLVDKKPVDSFPLYLPSIRIEKLPGEQVIVLLTAIQVEVSYFFDSYGFSVRVPSHLYLNKTEGLCGNCNGDAGDDMTIPGRLPADDVHHFGLSWLVQSLLDRPVQLDHSHENGCQVVGQGECNVLPPSIDPCFKLLDNPLFQVCNAVVDPLPYIAACQYDMCHSVDQKTSACNSLEAYARECNRFDICLSWRSAHLCPIECSAGMEYEQCGSGCVNNCEFWLRRETCLMSPADGCRCPGALLFNDRLNRCVPPDHCKPCDLANHFRGDAWKTDEGCTQCKCDDDGHVQCQSKQCVTHECLPGQMEQMISNTTCCGPSYICVTEKLQVCMAEECAPAPDCAPFYQLEVKRPADAINCCAEYTCTPPSDVCIYHNRNLLDEPGTENQKKSPAKKTPSKSTDKKLKVYAVNETWSDGACVQCQCVYDEFADTGAKAECLSQQCPDPVDEDYVLVQSLSHAQKCCPTLIRTACKHDAVVYQVGQSWPSDDGNICKRYACEETPKKGIFIQRHLQSCNSTCPLGWEYREDGDSCCGNCQPMGCVVDSGIVRKLNETWTPNPCTRAHCIKSDSAFMVETVKEVCEEPSDKESYIYDVTTTEDRCCPIHTKKACRSANGLQPKGSSWILTTDPCVTFICDEQQDQQAVIQKNVQSCPTTCQEQGYEYQSPQSGECCGRCVQVACVTDDGVVHAVGTSWSPDPCSVVTCSVTKGSAQLTMSQTQCSLAVDCPAENVVHKEGQCCPTCSAAQSQVNCAAEPMALNLTVGYIVYQSMIHGRCENSEPVAGLYECSGLCRSGTFHEIDLLEPTSDCSCCQPTDTRELPVDLKCADGSKWVQNIRIPTSCQCQTCAAHTVTDVSQFLRSQPSNKSPRQQRSDIAYPN